MSNLKTQNKNIGEAKLGKENFEFVQKDERIFDAKFETKPIGYFQDAMSRFAKNKTNLIATFILLILILLAILIPSFSSEQGLEPRLSFLPPRVPLLENIGIFDGTSIRKEVDVDKSTIDPVTGVGLPRNIDPEYIVPGTVKNYYIYGTDRIPEYEGGFNQLTLARSSSSFAVQSGQGVFFDIASTVITIDIESISNAPDARVNLYLETNVSAQGHDRYEIVGTYTEAGIYTINAVDYVTSFPLSGMKLRVEIASDTGLRATTLLNSIRIDDSTKDEPVAIYEGYSLSQFTRAFGSGDYARKNAKRLVADFKYRSYDAAFRDWEITLSESEYNAILAESPGMEASITPDPDNPNGWLFGEGYKITRVISTSEQIINNRVYTNYRVDVDFALYRGYNGIPYFIFGTDAAGRDMLVMVFMALGTSLIIGLIVSAINISFGVVYGAISGYYGGKIDLIMERFTEIVGRIPWLVTLSIFVVHIGTGAWTLILVLIVSGWIGISSVTRTQFYRYKGREYVLASRTLGAKDGRLIFRHILPNALGTIITSSVLMIPGVIFSESTISFLGFGIGHGQTFDLGFVKLTGVSLGVLLSDGQQMLVTYPHLTIYPALIISILMISFNMFGNALRDAFNPSLRGAEE